jgi:hypothetical protein
MIYPFGNESRAQFCRRKCESVRMAEKLATQDYKLQRHLSRVYFFAALFGGIGYFCVLTGPSRTMTLWKSLFFLYTVSPVMKFSGALALLYYLP